MPKFNFFVVSFSAVFAIAAGASEPNLLSEGKRELAAVKESFYQHKTDVNESVGRFYFDCSGFLSYALKRVAPEAYSEIPISRSREKRPLAHDFYKFFVGHNHHW